MKTSLRLVSTLSLLLLSLPLAARPARAVPSGADAQVLLFEAPRFIRQIEAFDGDLYAYLTDGSVCVWDARDGGQRVFCELPPPPDVDAAQYERLSGDERRTLDAAVSGLAEGDDALYGYNLLSGGIGRITPGGVEWLEGKLDVSPLWDAGGYPRASARAYGIEDALYVLAD